MFVKHSSELSPVYTSLRVYALFHIVLFGLGDWIGSAVTRGKLVEPSFRLQAATYYCFGTACNRATLYFSGKLVLACPPTFLSLHCFRMTKTSLWTLQRPSISVILRPSRYHKTSNLRETWWTTENGETNQRNLDPRWHVEWCCTLRSYHARLWYPSPWP